MASDTTLLLTARNMKHMLLDFVVSARTMGEHTGPIYVVFHSSEQYNFIEALEHLGVTILHPTNIAYDKRVAIDRWVKYTQIIELLPTNNICVCDVDMWCQRPIANITNHIPSDGVLFAPGVRKDWAFWGPEGSEGYYYQCLNRIVDISGGVLNCGFMAGTKLNLKVKFDEYTRIARQSPKAKHKSHDQSIWQYLFDKEKDSLYGHSFNSIPIVAEFETPILDLDGEAAHIVHLAGKRKRAKHLRFRHIYKDIFDDYIDKNNLRASLLELGEEEFPDIEDLLKSIKNSILNEGEEIPKEILNV